MPVPSSIADLSTTPSLNSPAGSESPSTIDDYLRTHAAFIKQVSDSKADNSAVVALNGSVVALNGSVVTLNGSKADKSEVVKLAGAQTVNDVKTFTSSPIVPNPATGTRSQAVATMQKFADEFGASLAGSGYQRLPSGLIIQWGSTSVNAASVLIVTLPVAFPTAFVCATANSSVTESYSEPVSAYAASLSQIAIRNNNGAMHPVAWFAIGY